jgi:hypothetical protein
LYLNLAATARVRGAIVAATAVVVGHFIAEKPPVTFS